jgi:hypothetical protein
LYPDPIDMDRLPERIIERLNRLSGPEIHSGKAAGNPVGASVVLFLLGPGSETTGGKGPCLILNKRSERVKQPGDLCCPGGGVSPRLDAVIARLLRLPGTPLVRWSPWRYWKRRYPDRADRLARHLATALREGAEEMRLNPLGVRFLGPMAPQHLVMFRRVIHPLAAWVSGQQQFFPNWEVDKILRIPLRELLNPQGYACYRLRIEAGGRRHVQDFPCYLYRGPDGPEVLWGATFRITVQFLETMFGFSPPGPEALPVVYATMGRTYMTGRR